MSMGNIPKKMISMILVLVLFAVSVPAQEVKATGKGPFYYCPKGGEGQYCNCIDDAFMGCSISGGVININEDVKLDFPDFVQYGCLNKDTTLVIGGDATVTIGKNGFRMDGLTQVLGTIDMEHSEGILYGEGHLEFVGGKRKKSAWRAGILHMARRCLMLSLHKTASIGALLWRGAGVFGIRSRSHRQVQGTMMLFLNRNTR